MGEDSPQPQISIKQASRQKSMLEDFVTSIVPSEEAFREDFTELQSERKMTDSTTMSQTEPT
jgi:hypothetical protein